jgi:hypothetical protein
MRGGQGWPGERVLAAGPHHDAYVCMVEREEPIALADGAPFMTVTGIDDIRRAFCGWSIETREAGR